MRMSYEEMCTIVGEQTGKFPTHVENAQILVDYGVMKDVNKAANTLSNRKFNKGYLKTPEQRAFMQYYQEQGVEFPEVCPIVQEDGFNILYWEYCDKCLQDLKNPRVRSKVADKQILVNEWRREPKNMRIIAMAGDAMDGGIVPIKNKNVLGIDISDTNYANGGVYFYYTVCPLNGKYNAGVARISITVDCKVKFEFDNPMKETEIYAKKELHEAGFVCVGRVLANFSRKTY